MLFKELAVAGMLMDVDADGMVIGLDTTAQTFAPDCIVIIDLRRVPPRIA